MTDKSAYRQYRTRGIHVEIEQRFNGVRGINCRFQLGTGNPVTAAIDRIISQKLGHTRPEIMAIQTATAVSPSHTKTGP